MEQEDLEAGHMVVITLRECDTRDCDPVAVYSVQDTPCLEEVLVATSTPGHTPHLIPDTIPGGTDVLQVDSVDTTHLALSTPVLFTPLTTASPTSNLSHSAFTSQTTLTHLVPATPTMASHQVEVAGLHTPAITPSVSFLAPWPPNSL